MNNDQFASSTRLGQTEVLTQTPSLYSPFGGSLKAYSTKLRPLNSRNGGYKGVSLKLSEVHRHWHWAPSGSFWAPAASEDFLGCLS